MEPQFTMTVERTETIEPVASETQPPGPSDGFRAEAGLFAREALCALGAVVGACLTIVAFLAIVGASILACIAGLRLFAYVFRFILGGS